jgi:hypothetical protein
MPASRHDLAPEGVGAVLTRHPCVAPFAADIARRRKASEADARALQFVTKARTE